MFKKLEQLSEWISKKICETDGNDDYFGHYYFSIHSHISFAFDIIIATILSLIFRYFPYIFLIIFILLKLRKMSAGSHAADAGFWCCIWTNLMWGIIGLSSTYLNKYYIIFLIISMLGYTGLREVPKYTKIATKHKKERQLIFRKKYIFRLTLVCLLNILCLILTIYFNLDLKKISMCFSMCILINKFSLTNLSFWILERLK